MSSCHGAHAKGVLQGRKHRKYTIAERNQLLKTFFTDYHGTNVTKFCHDKSISRLTFRTWLEKTKSSSKDETVYSGDRARQRLSMHPELDTLLFDWFLDHRKRFGTVPISRQVLLEKAIHFHALLHAPVSTFKVIPSTLPDKTTSPPLSPTQNNDTYFLFSDDLFIETEVTLHTTKNSTQTSNESVPATITAPTFTGLTNPNNCCFLNALVQQLYHLLPFREEIASREISQANTLTTQLISNFKTLFDEMGRGDRLEAISTQALYNQIKDNHNKPLISGRQYDVVEIFEFIVNALDLDMAPKEEVHSFKELLATTIITERICPMGHVTDCYEPSLCLTVSLTGSDSLVASLQQLKYGSYIGSYRCELCNPQRTYHGQAIERMLLYQLPKTFIVHLNRFSAIGSSQFRKNNAYYTFPDLSQLDLNPYLHSTVTREEKSYSGKNLYLYIKSRLMHYQMKTAVHPVHEVNDEPILIDDEQTNPFDEKMTLRSSARKTPNQYVRVANGVEALQATESVQIQESASTPLQLTEQTISSESLYHLHGVIAHTGTIKSGHYVSHIRSPKSPHSWCELNDIKYTASNSMTLPPALFGVRTLTRGSTVNSSTAYILWYVPGIIEQNDKTMEQSTPNMDAMESSPMSSEDTGESMSEQSESIPPDSETLRDESESDNVQNPKEKPECECPRLENWLNGWLKRRNIITKAYSGEAGSADERIKQKWLKIELQELFKKYNPADIWNADEAGLFFTQISRRTYCQAGEKPRGGKSQKLRISILFAASLTGKKRRPLLIHRSPSLLHVNDIKPRPFDFQQQANGWMTLEIFEEWLGIWNEELKTAQKHIALIVDGCRVHRTDKIFSQIRLQYLPACQTSIMQPLDQGIIRSFKALYRSLLLQLKIHSGDRSTLNYRLISYAKLICKAWARVSTKTIINCFHAAGWKPQFPENKAVLSIETNPGANSQQLSESSCITDRTTEEKEAVETLSKALHTMNKKPIVNQSEQTDHSAEDTGEADEIIIEVSDENAEAFEPFEIGEKERTIQLLGLQVPKKSTNSYNLRENRGKMDYVDVESDTTDSDREESSDIKLESMLGELDKYIRKQAPGARKDLLSGVLTSIRTDLSKQHEAPSGTSPNEVPHSPLIQTTLTLSPIKPSVKSNSDG